MIFQHFNLVDSRSVAGNVAYPLELAGMSRAARRAKVEELLELVGLSDRAGVHPARLSGGQKQRVGIARALAADPSVLLCDEATSALDPETTRSILALLKDLNQRLGLTIVLITHEMHVVKQICDSAALLEDGRLVESGALSALVESPHSVLARELLPRATAEPAGTQNPAIDITFGGSAADDPVIASLVRRFDIDVNVLGGSVETIAGQRVGRLRAGRALRRRGRPAGGEARDAAALARGHGVHRGEVRRGRAPGALSDGRRKPSPAPTSATPRAGSPHRGGRPSGVHDAGGERPSTGGRGRPPRLRRPERHARHAYGSRRPRIAVPPGLPFCAVDRLT